MSQQSKWEILHFSNTRIGDYIRNAVRGWRVQTTHFVAPDEVFFCRARLETDFEGCPADYSEPEGVVVFSSERGQEGVDGGGDGLALGGALGLVF